MDQWCRERLSRWTTHADCEMNRPRTLLPGDRERRQPSSPAPARPRRGTALRGGTLRTARGFGLRLRQDRDCADSIECDPRVLAWRAVPESDSPVRENLPFSFVAGATGDLDCHHEGGIDVAKAPNLSLGTANQGCSYGVIFERICTSSGTAMSVPNAANRKFCRAARRVVAFPRVVFDNRRRRNRAWRGRW